MFLQIWPQTLTGHLTPSFIKEFNVVKTLTEKVLQHEY